MDEEQNELPPPPRFRYKLLKIMTLTLFFLVLFFSIGFTGLKATSSSSFCSSCHEMKPEFYTWKASTHAEVDCVNCHTQPGVKNIPKDEANVLAQIFKKETNTYTAPIHMPKEIPDSACERCHNMSNRDVTPSGDLIIPHVKHKKEGIKCFECHSGVAHGKIADRKMTYQADYYKWDQTLGNAAMEDTKYIRPDMDTCMECHKVRNGPLNCNACHKSGMVPASHKQKDFKLKYHGSYAKKSLPECNKCHAYMSKKEIDGFEEVPTFNQFLTNQKAQTKKKVTPDDYAKQNTFCKDCHSKRPPSHTKNWPKEHGRYASKSRENCIACHDVQQLNNSGVTNVSCSTCHPSSHNTNKYWRSWHPIDVSKFKRPQTFCYTCHNKEKCSACHGEPENKNH